MDPITEDVPYSLLAEAEALATIGKILRLTEKSDPTYTGNLQIQDISSLGYLIQQSAARMTVLQEHVELAYENISEHTLKNISERVTE